jgi:dihydroorotase
VSKRILIQNAQLINEGKIFPADLLIENDQIARIEPSGIQSSGGQAAEVIDATGLHLIPGIIDTQVHFREPGLTHKDDLFSASRSAVSGGTTSFMEMPNTNPQTLTQQLLTEKYALGAAKSLANYSFFMGTSNQNLEEVLKTDPDQVCGIKIFMGSSTGNMLVDDPEILEALFSKNHPNLPISLHCEDEKLIRENTDKAREKYGEDVPIEMHPWIRSEEACYRSSSMAVQMAKEFNARIHVLHLTTAKEMNLFSNDIPRSEKRITAEVCVHHLWFSANDYPRKGNFIKWNPAIKTENDRKGLFAAMKDGRIDVIATDHAPHTLEEKSNKYFKAPSGGPLVQHSLVAMIEFAKKGEMELTQVIDKMCHAPADIFRIPNRGYLREGYKADLVLVNLQSPWIVDKSNINYKCGYSPFEGEKFSSQIHSTFVNGKLVYQLGKWDESIRGERLNFRRT